MFQQVPFDAASEFNSENTAAEKDCRHFQQCYRFQRCLGLPQDKPQVHQQRGRTAPNQDERLNSKDHDLSVKVGLFAI